MSAIHRPSAAPRLTGIVVAQDNADTIATVLEQLGRVADEIVVVDGGSRDATPELAARYPKVRLFHRPCDGDLSTQKNFAIDRARGAWVLVVDTDELLSARLQERIPRLVRRRFPLWYRLPRVWLVEREGGWLRVESPRHGPDWQVRLFRNLPGFRYDAAARRVHHVFPRARGRRGWKLRDAPLLHFTLALVDQAGQRAKLERYAVLEPETVELNRAYVWQGDERFAPYREPLAEVLRAPALGAGANLSASVR